MYTRVTLIRYPRTKTIYKITHKNKITGKYYVESTDDNDDLGWVDGDIIRANFEFLDQEDLK